MSAEFHSKKVLKPRTKMERKATSPAREPEEGIATPKKGVTLKLNGHELRIPAGAVPADQLFRLSEPPSDFFQVNIEAVGHSQYVFTGSKPVTLIISYEGKKNSRWNEVYIYQTDSAGNPIAGANPLPGSNNPPGPFTTRVKGFLDHLSGYVIAGGRTSD